VSDITQGCVLPLKIYSGHDIRKTISKEVLKVIKRLIIKNFRSIENLDLKLGKMNALIGPNNSGKTNIMSALNIVLRELYPSIRIFDDGDFFNYVQNKIEIKAIFDAPLRTNSRVYGFCVEYDGNGFNYAATNQDGLIIAWSPGRDVRVSNAMRDEVSLMYVGVNRQAYQQIRPTKWTIYGKILKHINNGIDIGAKRSYETQLKDAYNSNIGPHLNTFKDVMKKFTREHTGLDIDFKFSVLDPTEVLKSLRPYVWDDVLSKNFDVEKVGAGVQSALAIALARAYAYIVRRPLILAIEEPELYLHPHACRHFYRILQDLADNGIQIIFTTHNRSFVDIINYKSIHLVRKEQGKTIVKSGMDFTIPPDESIRLASLCDDRVNEIFFANHVVLVEGSKDQIACRCALNKQACNINEKNVSIVECGGKDSMNYIAKLLKHFDVDCYTMFDEDPGDPNTLAKIQESQTILGPDHVLIQSPDLEGLFGIPRRWGKKEALIEFPKWFEVNQMPQVYIDLKTKIFGS